MGHKRHLVSDIRDSNVIREAGVGASKEAQHGEKEIRS